MLGLLVLAASLVVGANLLGTRDALFGSATPAPRAAAASRGGAFTRVQGSAAAPKTVLRSQPWWQSVGRLKGAGARSLPAVRVSGEAIQWRIRWSCTSGRFVVRRSAGSKPLIDAACGAAQTTELTGKVDHGLRIEAAGPWTAHVEQQVDVPLIEPPLPAMTAAGARAVAGGSLYRIDQVGKGRMTIYRLAGGRYALRLSNFYVSPNIDLELRLSPLRAPHSTHQYLSTPARLAAPLDITTGSLNFVLPAGVNPLRYRSVVVWCPLITSAYAAATIERGR